MKKNKILIMLNLTIALTLFGNITVFATKKNKNQIQDKKQIENINLLDKKTKKDEKQKSTTEKQNKNLEKENRQENSVSKIGGVKFRKLFTTPQQITPYFNEDRRIMTLIDPKDETNLTIAIPMKVKNNKGEPHALEHLLVSNNLGKIAPWETLPEENSKNADSGINAYTTMFDLDNDIALVVIKIDENTLKNEKQMDYLGKQLTGYADFLNDDMRSFNREILNKKLGKKTSRILLEMYEKENPSEDDKNALCAKEEKDMWKRFSYNSGGIYEEMLNNNFEDLKNYYFENIVKNKPTILLKVKNLEEANKTMSLLEKFYFSKRKNSEARNLLKENNEKKKYFEVDVSPMYAERKRLLKYYKLKDGVSSPRESENNITVEYIIPNCTSKKIGAISCLKFDFIKKMFDKENYPFLDINLSAEDNKLKITIFPKDKNIIKQKDVEKFVGEIETKIIEYLNKNEIQKTDIEKESLNFFKNVIENKTYTNFGKFCDNITKSYLAKNKPFSEEYFLVDKDGQFENNAEELEEYCLNNCGNILKETLNKNKKKIILYRLNKEKSIIKDNLPKKHEERKVIFPITYNKEYMNMNKNNSAILDVTNEIVIALLLNELQEMGLIYNTIEDKPIKGKFFRYCRTELEKQNIKKFFEDGVFKNLLQKLKKEIDSNSKNKYIEDKINYFKNTLLNNIENSLKNDKKKVENYIEYLKKIKGKDKLTRDDITNQENSQIFLGSLLNLIDCTETIIKFDEKHLNEEKKKRYEEDEEMFKNKKELAKAINTRTKNDIKNNVIDEKTKKIFHKKLDLYIKILNRQIETYKKYIEEIGKIKQQANSLKVENIKEALRNIEEKKFNEMNK